MDFEEALQEFDHHLYRQSLAYQLEINHSFMELATPETKKRIEQDIKKIQDSLAEIEKRISGDSAPTPST